MMGPGPDKTRSALMSRIRPKDTTPELMVRRELFRLGFRYRLHSGKLPGRPDLVLPRFRAVVFVNGCFWHAHDCPAFKWPKADSGFWRNKLEANAARDRRNEQALLDMGWRVAVVWECGLKGRSPDRVQQAIKGLADWLESGCLKYVSPADGELEPDPRQA